MLWCKITQESLLNQRKLARKDNKIKDDNKLENEWAEEVEKTFCTKQQLQRKVIKDKWGNKNSNSEEFFYIQLFAKKKPLYQRQ